MHQGQLIAQYREYMNMTQEDLARELGVHVRTVQKLESKPMVRSTTRRWFLVGLLSIPATQLALTGVPPWSKKTSFSANDDTMSFFENELATHWQVYKTAGPKIAAQSLGTWMNQVTAFATLARGTPWQYRACLLLSMSYQLQGSIARETKDAPHAITAYQQAFTVAQEIDNIEMMAASRLRQGWAYRDDPLEALEYFNHALAIVQGSSLPRLRGNILQACAETYAKINRPQECWRSIGLAEHIFGREEKGHERTHVTFTVGSATAYKGSYALYLKDYERAAALLEKGLGLMAHDPSCSFYTRARFIVRKAKALSSLSRIDECVATAEEAWTIASYTGDKRILEEVEDVYNTLLQSRWRKEADVVRLGKQIVAYHGDTSM